MTIPKKLYLGVGVLAAILIGLALFLQLNIKNTRSQIIDVHGYIELQKSLAARIVDHYKWADALAMTIIFGKEFKGQIDHTKCTLGKWYYAATPPKEIEEAFKKMEEPHRLFHATAPRIIYAINKGNIDLAKKIYYEETKPLLKQTQETLDEMKVGVKKLTVREFTDMQSSQSRMGTLSIIAYVGIIGLFITASVVFTKSLASPLQKSVSLAKAVASGDLARTFESAELNRADELGTLAQALQAMVVSLKAKIQESEQQAKLAQSETQKAQKATQEAKDTKQQVERVNQGLLQAAAQVEAVVEQLTSASEQLAAQVEQASKGSEEQRSRTGETATAMEEMNATVLEVAKNASQAAGASEQARAKAADGAKVVSAAVGAIHKVQGQAQDMKNKIKELGQQAEQIGKIMNVIDDIADQTNLLALNAAIEAARAGDAGRGFAVVADEVRKLAEKTMNATKEVGDAINAIQQGTRANIQGMDQSVAAIAEATKLANQSGEALQEILTLSDQAADQVRSIAAAAEEQSTTSEEINRGVEDINRIAAETSEVMNQSAQAISELAKQAQSLQNLVQQLKQG